MSDGDSEPLGHDDRPKRSGCAPLFFVAAVIYSLSIGPVFGLTGGPFANSSVVAKGFMIFFWPVIFAAELIPSLGDALEWYVEIFG